ncbi:hypothetical protein JTB14_036011 [Gonioctena quinquepunctata]|nr:hypothetical protein JTB14_036011 [Gonioctena quinquepunctata]
MLIHCTLQQVQIYLVQLLKLLCRNTKTTLSSLTILGRSGWYKIATGSWEQLLILHQPLESFNKAMKDSNTLRERFPLSRFLVVAKEMVNQWSTNYTTNPEENYVAKDPSISLKDWTESYHRQQMCLCYVMVTIIGTTKLQLGKHPFVQFLKRIGKTL